MRALWPVAQALINTPGATFVLQTLVCARALSITVRLAQLSESKLVRGFASRLVENLKLNEANRTRIYALELSLKTEKCATAAMRPAGQRRPLSGTGSSRVDAGDEGAMPATFLTEDVLGPGGGRDPRKRKASTSSAVSRDSKTVQRAELRHAINLLRNGGPAGVDQPPSDAAAARARMQSTQKKVDYLEWLDDMESTRAFQRPMSEHASLAALSALVTEHTSNMAKSAVHKEDTVLAEKGEDGGGGNDDDLLSDVHSRPRTGTHHGTRTRRVALLPRVATAVAASTTRPAAAAALDAAGSRRHDALSQLGQTLRTPLNRMWGEKVVPPKHRTSGWSTAAPGGAPSSLVPLSTPIALTGVTGASPIALTGASSSGSASVPRVSDLGAALASLSVGFTCTGTPATERERAYTYIDSAPYCRWNPKIKHVIVKSPEEAHHENGAQEEAEEEAALRDDEEESLSDRSEGRSAASAVEATVRVSRPRQVQTRRPFVLQLPSASDRHTVRFDFAVKSLPGLEVPVEAPPMEVPAVEPEAVTEEAASLPPVTPVVKLPLAEQNEWHDVRKWRGKMAASGLVSDDRKEHYHHHHHHRGGRWGGPPSHAETPTEEPLLAPERSTEHVAAALAQVPKRGPAEWGPASSSASAAASVPASPLLGGMPAPPGWVAPPPRLVLVRPQDARLRMTKFQHVEGCKVCADLYRHYELPDGRLMHYYHADTSLEMVRCELCVCVRSFVVALEWHHVDARRDVTRTRPVQSPDFLAPESPGAPCDMIAQICVSEYPAAPRAPRPPCRGALRPPALRGTLATAVRSAGHPADFIPLHDCIGAGCDFFGVLPDVCTCRARTHD